MTLPSPEAGPEAAEDIPDAETVAQTDPLVGLLRMQVSATSNVCSAWCHAVGNGDSWKRNHD